MMARLRRRPPPDDVAYDQQPAGWPTVTLIVACCIMLVFTSRSLTVSYTPWWSLLYTIAVAAIVAWRLWWRRWMLVLWGACLFAACVTRALVYVDLWIDQGIGANAIPQNALICLFAWRFTISQGRWSY